MSFCDEAKSIKELVTTSVSCSASEQSITGQVIPLANDCRQRVALSGVSGRQTRKMGRRMSPDITVRPIALDDSE